MSEHVHLIGFVDDEDLPALYTCARAFAFPSLYEGFGLPVLESMACGTPVLTSTVSSLPEVAGDAALLVDPLDLDAITDQLDRLIGDEALREQLILAGQRQIARFSWEQSAQQLISIYQSLVI